MLIYLLVYIIGMNGIDIMVNKIRNNRPVDSSKPKYTEKQIKHFVDCRDINCNKCKEIVSKID